MAVTGRAIGRGAALALASVVVYVAAAETWLRITDDGFYHVWQPGFELEFDPDPAYLPGVSGAYRFRINELGMRADPMGPDPQYRLLAVGGSTTICSYLDDAEAWPRVVQARLDAVLGPGSTWVGNVGSPGHATAQHVLQVDRLLGQHPEIGGVLVLAGINHLLLSLAYQHADRSVRVELSPGEQSPEAAQERAFDVLPRSEARGPWYERTAIGHALALRRRREANAASGAMIRRDGSNVEAWREHRRRAGRLVDELPDLTYALRSFARNLNQIVDATERHGARVVFLTQPSLWREDLSERELDRLWTGGPPLDRMTDGAVFFSAGALARAMELYNQRTLRICRRRRVECFDLAAQLPRTLENFYDDAHFTEAGARRVADLVAGYLLATPPLAARAGRGAP